MPESTERATWTDPETCPFCGEALRNGGAGFVEHADANADCRTRFDEWRENVAGDVRSEWSG
ncbi:hypothetical protein HALDL1_09855 [Halobacterium sp. DL1]|jgi:hypothetical protein|nr:hypothetical protein HALDL1_09855 [Halobacterium sp. DL1]